MKNTQLKQALTALELPRIVVSDFWEVCPFDITELKSDVRLLEVAAWRHIALIYYIVEYEDIWFATRKFRKDRSLAYYAFKRAKNIKYDTPLQQVVEKITNYINLENTKNYV